MTFDAPTTMLAEFASSVRFEDMNLGIRSATIRHHLDAVGCVLRGFDSLPCRIARDVARLSTTVNDCSAFGVGELVVPEQAVFANSSAAARHLDFNDGYYSPAKQHPSDMLPAVAAAAEPRTHIGRSIRTDHEVQLARNGLGSPS